MKPCNENLLKVIEYARKMLFLADKGDMQRDDDGCGVLYGVLRDSAYRVKVAAEKEVQLHRQSGKWDEEDSDAVSDDAVSA